MPDEADTFQPGASTPRRLVPLAPRPRDAAQPTSAQQETPTLRGRRPLVDVACQSCRKTKSKCTGDRPACRRCERRRIRCEYATAPGESLSKAIKREYRILQDQATNQEKVLELLKVLPDGNAQRILWAIRSGTPLETICKQVAAGDALAQLATTPENRFRYELLYKTEMPIQLVRDNPYLNTLIYQGASLYPPYGRTAYLPPSATSDAAVPLGGFSHETAYLMPFHAATVVDPLLSNVKPSLWTAVCKDDKLMRDMLGVWLRCEYSFTSAFQKDYFFEDMISQKEDFCSELLVNAVLAYCCVCYTPFSDRAEYWKPETLVYRFLAEAKRLWELEAMKPRLTTVQAGIIFTVFHILCGLDEIGQAYRLNSLSLAHRLDLFKGSVRGESERMRNGKVFTAWALYKWEALTAFSFQQPPLLTEGPAEPLPDPATSSGWYGEIWLKYSSNHLLVPSQFGYLFEAKSKLRIIMQKFCTMAYARGVAVELSEAYRLYAMLREWRGSLPDPLRAKDIVFPAQLQLHMYLHHLTLAIFEPLLEVSTDVERMHEPDPPQIVAEATRNMQTLVRIYYLRHGFEAMDLFIVIPLIYFGFKCLERIDDQTPREELDFMRSTLMLVVNGLYHQRRNHYLSEALYRVIRRRMRPEEVHLVKEALELGPEENEGNMSLKQAVRSHWPVRVVKRKEDLDQHILANLVNGLNVTERLPRSRN